MSVLLPLFKSVQKIARTPDLWGSFRIVKGQTKMANCSYPIILVKTCFQLFLKITVTRGVIGPISGIVPM